MCPKSSGSWHHFWWKSSLIFPKTVNSPRICSCLVAKSCPTLLRPHGGVARLLCPWDFPDKNSGVRCHFLFQESSQPRDRNRVSCTVGGFFTTEPPGKPWMHIEGRGYILPIFMFPINSSFSHPFSNYLLCTTSMPSTLIGIYRDTSVSEIKITPSWHLYFSRSELHACQVAFSSIWLFANQWIVACQAPLSMKFFRQVYWSGLSCPLAGDLPNSGTELMSPVAPALQADSLLLSHWGSPELS